MVFSLFITQEIFDTYASLSDEYKTYVSDKMSVEDLFRDGKGRLGRLLVNKILLQKGMPMLILSVDQRANYLNCLKTFRESAEPLTDLFFDTIIIRMKQKIAQKRNATEIFRFGWLSEDFQNKI